ncbi:MAG: CPBP family intramembrane metalloprotease [Chloroflexi bacterium]|nr:CPBP family intramembrane metalloprotease [Chloroflexota bacterium]
MASTFAKLDAWPLDASQQSANDQLQQASIALQAGRKAEARHLLEDVLQADARSERGWLWLADAVDTDAERRFCLTRVLAINRRNALARRSLEVLGPGAIESPFLQLAAAALGAGHRAKARNLLKEVVHAAPRSERGWLWLADAVTTDEERRFCLSMVIGINRRNGLARRELEILGPGPAWSPLDKQAGILGSQTRQRFQTAAGAISLEVADSRAIPAVIPIAIGYLALVTLAEVLTASIELRVGLAQGGLVLHGILFAILLIHTSLTWGRPGYRILFSLAFAPLIRLLSLSMPLADFPRIYWYFIVSVPLFTATFIALGIMGFSRLELGLTLKALPLQAVVAFTGLSLGYIEYRILQPVPLASSLSWKELWGPALILLVCTGFIEELIFRGMMQVAVTRVLGSIWGVVYVALIFAVLHVGYQSLFDVVFVFGVALFFGLVKERTGSLLGVTLAHGMTNILLFLTLPLGMNHFDLVASYLFGP